MHVHMTLVESKFQNHKIDRHFSVRQKRVVVKVHDLVIDELERVAMRVTKSKFVISLTVITIGFLSKSDKDIYEFCDNYKTTTTLTLVICNPIYQRVCPFVPTEHQDHRYIGREFVEANCTDPSCNIDVRKIRRIYAAIITYPESFFTNGCTSN